MDARTQLSPDEAIAALAAVLAEPARARMLCALLDGRAHTATELAVIAEISSSTASGHLARLLEQDWVVCVRQGKHRYYTLADDDVADLIETLLGMASRRLSPGAARDDKRGGERYLGDPAATGDLSPLRTRTPDPLRHARTCYNHAAGEFAVGLLDRILARKWLEPMVDGYALTPAGRAAFARIGLDEGELHERARGRRHFAKACLDWSERRPHLAGVLGTALLEVMLGKHWVVQVADSRALDVTPSGRRALDRWLDAKD